MQWPEWFPPGCPPADANHASGTFYRLVGNDPPAPDDFTPGFLLFPGRNFCKRPQPTHGVSRLFMACGLTVFRAKEDATRMKEIVPRLRNKFLAGGELMPDLGKIKHTPHHEGCSHHCWWVPNGMDPTHRFTVIDEEPA